MLDLQAVFVRDFVRLQDIDSVPMLRVRAGSPARAAELAGTTAVTVDGATARFFRTPGGDLLVALPADSYLSAGALQVVDAPGVGIAVTVVRDTVAANGVTGSTSEIIPPNDITLDASTLRVYGANFERAVEVRVNGRAVPFVVLDRTTLLCSVESSTAQIETVEVVASSSRVTGTSYFAYMLGQNPVTTSGIDKLVGQFVKLLLTTLGSDTFNPDLGGNLQKWAGQTTNQTGTAGAAQVIAAIQTMAGRMTAGQLRANLPPDEVLAYVEVTNFQTSTADPSVVEIGLRIHTLSSKIAAIDMMVGGLQQATQELAGAFNAR